MRKMDRELQCLTPSQTVGTKSGTQVDDGNPGIKQGVNQQAKMAERSGFSH